MLGERIVVGKQARELLEAVDEQGFDGLCHPAVKCSAALRQDTAVGRLLHKRMLEDVLVLGGLLAQADQLVLLELPKALLDVVRGSGDGLQNAQKKTPPDDGG